MTSSRLQIRRLRLFAIVLVVVVGATVGTVGLLAFALNGCGGGDSGDTGSCWDDLVLGTIIGVGSGGTLGALVGGLFEKPGPKAAGGGTELLPE